MQSVIKKFFVNDVTTKYGQKKKYDIYIDTEQGEWKFSTWGGQWNQDWRQGITIIIPELGDQRWKVTQYNGNDQYMLSAPPQDGYAQPSNPAPMQAPRQTTLSPTLNHQIPVEPQTPVMNTVEPTIPVIKIEETSSLELQIEEILKIVNEINKQLKIPASQALGIEKPANEDEVDLSSVKF